MKTFGKLCRFTAFTVTMAIAAGAQTSNNQVQQSLEAKYPLTKTTNDRSDIVTPGAILTLKKGKIFMVSTNSLDVYQNKYQKGAISQNLAGKASEKVPGIDRLCGLIGRCPAMPPAAQLPPTRTFVADEKMWVTGITVSDKSVVLELYTDAYDNVRYHAGLTFPLSSAASAEQLIAEVFDVQLPDTAPATETAPGTAKIGLTTEQVVAILGQPVTVVDMGAKVIYRYSNLKVTFVDRLVVDAE